MGVRVPPSAPTFAHACAGAAAGLRRSAVGASRPRALGTQSPLPHHPTSSPSERALTHIPPVFGERGGEAGVPLAVCSVSASGAVGLSVSPHPLRKGLRAHPSGAKWPQGHQSSNPCLPAKIAPKLANSRLCSVFSAPEGWLRERASTLRHRRKMFPSFRRIRRASEGAASAVSREAFLAIASRRGRAFG